MQIGVIGGGALGLLCSSYLSRQHDVTLYVRRKEQYEAMQNQHIALSIQGNEQCEISKVKVKLTDELREADCIIVAVKQADMLGVLNQLNQLTMDVPLIFLQNGMSHIERMKQSPHPTYIGIVQHGAVRKNHVSVNHLGLGEIKLASVTGTEQEVNYLVDTLHTTAFPFKLEHNYKQVMKEKLIINAVINPLTAIFDVKNGSIMSNPSYRKLAKQLCIEAASVFDLDAEIAWHAVKHVAYHTSKNTSSMRADIQRKNKTEIEAISGYLLTQSQSDLPYTHFVYQAILGMEQEE